MLTFQIGICFFCRLKWRILVDCCWVWKGWNSLPLSPLYGELCRLWGVVVWPFAEEIWVCGAYQTASMPSDVGGEGIPDRRVRKTPSLARGPSALMPRRHPPRVPRPDKLKTGSESISSISGVAFLVWDLGRETMGVNPFLKTPMTGLPFCRNCWHMAMTRDLTHLWKNRHQVHVGYIRHPNQHMLKSSQQ